MNKKSFIEKSRIEKKLCIDCNHCPVYYRTDTDKIMCGLYRDNIDNSEIYLAAQCRNSIFRCNGRKWEIKPNITICESEEDADEQRLEYEIEQLMPNARRIVNGELPELPYTNGFFEMAKERARKEIKINIK